MIEIKQVNIDEQVEKVYYTLLDKCVDMDNNQVLFSHTGIFSQDLINSLSEASEEILIGLSERKPIIKRVFSILIEGLQNIRKHGESLGKDHKSGMVILSHDDQAYCLTFGNLVLRSEVTNISLKLNQLNSLSDSDVKELYMQVLSKGILSNKGGAGLGFITMRLKSKSPLGFDFYHLDDTNSYFVVTVKLSKSKEG